MGKRPATVLARLLGLEEEAKISEKPGGIEEQERMGQIAFSARNDLLPKDCLNCSFSDLEKLGFVIGEAADDIFMHATYPDGWTCIPDTHSQYVSVLDEHGRARISIYYKAAFYDRRSQLTLIPRYDVGLRPVTGWGAQDYDRFTTPLLGAVYDRALGKVIWSTADEVDPIPFDAPEIERERNDRERKALYHQLHDWAKSFIPDWRNPMAYWD